MLTTSDTAKPVFDVAPLYSKVKADLIRRISQGEWKPHFPIPAEPELARYYSCSSGTVRKALDEMESDGLVSRQQGRGTYVNDVDSDNKARMQACEAAAQAIIDQTLDEARIPIAKRLIGPLRKHIATALFEGMPQ